MNDSHDAEWRHGLNVNQALIYDPSRVGHAWNVFARVLIREMLAV